MHVCLRNIKPQGQSAYPESPKSPQVRGSFPRTGRALLSCPRDWGGLIFLQRAGGPAKAPTPHCVSCRNAHLHQQPEDRHSTKEGAARASTLSSPCLSSCKKVRAEEQEDKGTCRGEKPKDSPPGPPALFSDKTPNTTDHLGLNHMKP